VLASQGLWARWQPPKTGVHQSSPSRLCLMYSVLVWGWQDTARKLGKGMHLVLPGL
jgi:hypothetical protein